MFAAESLSRVRLFATPGAAARQAFLSFTVSLSLLKFMSFESVMPSSHLTLCRPFSFGVTHTHTTAGLTILQPSQLIKTMITSDCRFISSRAISTGTNWSKVTSSLREGMSRPLLTNVWPVPRCGCWE